MSLSAEVDAAIEAARQETHAIVDRAFAELRIRLSPPSSAPDGEIIYTTPTDDDCRDPRIKNGQNLTADGVEVLFRLLDAGAGYNSAGRKLSITQSAVKNRKKEWEAEGGQGRKKRYVSWLDVREAEL